MCTQTHTGCGFDVNERTLHNWRLKKWTKRKFPPKLVLSGWQCACAYCRQRANGDSEERVVCMEERNECDCMRERIHYMDTYVLFLVWQGWIGSYAMNPHVRVYCIDYRYRALSILYRKFSVDPCQIQNNMFSFMCVLSLHLNICSSFLTWCETSPNRWYMYEYIVHTLVDIGACGYIVRHIY